MAIHRNNYELFFIDYLDGQLSAEQESELMQFLQQNPDLREELEMMQDVPNISDLAADDVVFPEKDQLKKEAAQQPLSGSHFADLCIAAVENDITTSQQTELNTLLKKHPEKKQDAELYKKTCLQADLSVQYPDKKALYRGKVIRLGTKKTIYRLVAVAAMLALIFTVPALWQLPGDKQPALLSDSQLPGKNYTATTIITEPTAEPPQQNQTIPPIQEAVANAGIPHQHSQDEKTTVPTEENFRRAATPLHFPVTETAKVRGIALNMPHTIDAALQVPASMRQTPSVIEIQSTVNQLVALSKAAKSSSNKNTPLHEVQRVAKGEINPQDIVAEQKEKFRFWNIAAAGVNGLARLTNRPAYLEPDYNENGEIETLSFDSNLITFSTSFGNNRNE